MEKSRIQEFTSRRMVIEVFSIKPGPREVLTAAVRNRTDTLVFSPLYYDLAESVLQEDPGLSVYAVVPPGYRKPSGIKALEMESLGAADTIIALLESRFPGDEPVYLTLMKYPEESIWDSMARNLARRNERFRLEMLTISPEKIKQRDFRLVTPEKTDVLLLFLGEYSPGVAKESDPDSRGELPEMIISDRPVDSGGNIRSWTLAVDWERVYRALLDGSEEADPWVLIPDSEKE